MLEKFNAYFETDFTREQVVKAYHTTKAVVFGCIIGIGLAVFKNTLL